MNLLKYGMGRMNIKDILKAAIDKKASDILLVAGCSMAFKINNDVVKQAGEVLMQEKTQRPSPRDKELPGEGMDK